MGLIRMGVPKDIVLFLKNEYDITCFVETGTYHGSTSIWAAKEFLIVKTIEYSSELHEMTSTKNSNIKNIEFLYGDSRERLKDVTARLSEPILFWLDAHWCSFESYGESDQCPLLEELDIILDTGIDHIILIDDARLFLCPPPAPNFPEQYPNITDIIKKLSKKNMYVVVFEDVVIAVPSAMKTDFMSYMQSKVNENQKLLDLLYEKRVRNQKIKDYTKAVLWPFRFLWSKS